MEANGDSKKRKRSSSSTPNPFIGIFTRSKSQIHIRRHRSGRAWSDSLSKSNYHHWSPTRSSFNQNNEISHTTINNLRTRRIFSLCENSKDQKTFSEIVLENCLCNKASVCKCNGIRKKMEREGIDDDLSQSKPSEAQIEKRDTGVTCTVPNWSDTNLNLCAKEGNYGADPMSDRIDDSSEEFIQRTPPDSDVLCTREVTHATIDPINNSISKHKLGLNPCSRLKLFKTPSSFSYRRLLPYLMEIAKDDSCASRNGQCPNHEKGGEVKPTTESLDSQTREIFSAKLSTDNSRFEPHSVDSGTLQNAILNEGSQRPTPPDNSDEFQMLLDLQKEPPSEVITVVSDKPSKPELAHDNARQIHGSDPPVMSSCSPVSMEPLRKQVSYHCPDNAQEDSKISGLNFTTHQVLWEKGLFQPEAIICPGGLAEPGLTKGILKRNPRGCRGLCTCLNCASFRLHAERAFEFSRNQMLDAEELALELIKELSYLRTMLEKYEDNVSDHAITQANQVREACRNASKTEDLAKIRLNQMNCDLNVHCRVTCLQRSRVTFANCIEEKAIFKADMASKQPEN